MNYKKLIIGMLDKATNKQLERLYYFIKSFTGGRT